MALAVVTGALASAIIPTASEDNEEEEDEENEENEGEVEIVD